MLPSPTTDPDHARADLDRWGYCLVADALTPDEVAVARTRLLEQAEAERELGVAYRDYGVNQRIWNLQNKGRCFVELLTHPGVIDLVRHVLGREFILSSFTANIANPGSEQMGLHTDQWFMPRAVDPDDDHRRVGDIGRGEFYGEREDQPAMIQPPISANVMWMLSAFSAENGGTRLVPGSHRSGMMPDVERSYDDEIALSGEPGTACIFEGRTWHGTGANTSADSQRLGVLTNYCGPQMRQQNNFTLSTADRVIADASPELLALLGFKVWNAYGRIDDPTAEFVTRDADLVGELKPSR